MDLISRRQPRDGCFQIEILSFCLIRFQSGRMISDPTSVSLTETERSLVVFGQQLVTAEQIRFSPNEKILLRTDQAVGQLPLLSRLVQLLMLVQA